MDVLDRSFTKKTVVGLGALKGAPCTISNITESATGITIKFSWTGTDGTKQEQSAFIPRGPKGDPGDASVIDLTDYYTKDDIDNKKFLTEQDIINKQDKLKAGDNITIGADNTISATKGTEIDDTVKGTDTTYSSDKIEKIKTELQTNIDNMATGGQVDLSNYYSKEEIDNKKFLTEHQDITGKQDKLTAGNNITISDDNTISAADGVKIDDTKSSADNTYSSNKIESIKIELQTNIDNITTGGQVNLTNYYTKDEIDNKNYLTEHQDITGKQDKLTVGDNITISDDNVISAISGTEINDTQSSNNTTYSSNKIEELKANQILEDIKDVNIDDTVIGDYVALIRDKDTNGWKNENLEFENYSEEEILSKLGLSDKELIKLSQYITDETIISPDKTWNSSVIYAQIKKLKKDCNQYTLQEIAKKAGKTYKKVIDADLVISEDYLYLVGNDTDGYNIYALVEGVATKLTSTDIKLDDYVLKEDGKSLVSDDDIVKIHTHTNKNMLDKISEDENGNPLYNGKLIQAEKEIWTGTKEEYNAITDKKDDITYIVTDEEDTVASALIDDTKTDTQSSWSSKKINEKFIKIHKKNTSVTTTVYQWFAARYDSQTKQVSTTIPITIADDVSNVSLDFGGKGVLLHTGSGEVEQFPTQISAIGIEDSKSLGLLRFDIKVDYDDISINCIAIPDGTTITFS